MEYYLLVAIALAVGIFAFSIVVLILSKQGKEKDSFQSRVDSIAGQGKAKLILDEDMDKPLSERFLKPLTNKALGTLRKVAPQEESRSEVVDAKAAKMKRQLRQAGIKLSLYEYQVFRLITIIVVAIVIALVIFLLSRNILYAIVAIAIGGYLAYAILRFSLTSRISARQQSMQRQLPEVLDMISVSVEAGLGFEQAMVEVVRSFDGPLIDEIEITNREMAMGRSRSDALTILAERCVFDEIQTFTRAIIQATQMGIAIKNVLRTQSEFMRQSRKNKVEEKAMKVSVKILLPMVAFIFPVIFIVLLGPAVVQIADAFL